MRKILSLNRVKTFSGLRVTLFLGLAITQVPCSHGQDAAVVPEQTEAQTASARPAPQLTDGSSVPNSDTGDSSRPASAAQPLAPEEITKELEAMRARIDQLEKELKAREAAPVAAAQSPTAGHVVIGAGVNHAGQRSVCGHRTNGAKRTFCLRRLDLAERESPQQRCSVGFKVLHSRNSDGR